MNRFSWLLFSILLLGPAASAGAQGIQVRIDRPEATVRDQLTLSVVIDGAERAQPRLPDLPDFQVIPMGQQSQINMRNGRTSVKLIHNYALIPKRTGTFTIGPASVEIDGKVYRSQPFNVRIVAASATPRESDALFVRARVSNDSPYVGEQVIYTWQFFRRVQVGDAQLLSPFDFEGFLVEDLGDVREYRSTRGGVQYLVSEIKKAIFPQEEGTLTLPESQLRCQVVVNSRRRRGSLFDDFFGRAQTETRVLATRPIEVNVRPLPAAPPGYSGLVGEFSVKSRIMKRELKVGESATWKLTVSGRGNVAMIGEPPLGDLSRFKIYDDKPKSSIDRSGSELSGSRSYTKALVPLEAGELTLPAVRLIYFDPKAGSYQTASSAAVNLSVAPADGEEDLRLTESVAPTTGKVAVRILADDILPIKKDLDAVELSPFGHRADPVFFAGLLAPPLLFLGLLAADRRRRHFEVNVDAVRRRSALKKAQKGLDEAAAKVKAGDHPGAVQLTSRALREYVGDKVTLEGSAFTPEEAAAQLKRCGVKDEVIRETREQLESLEAAQYAGGTAESDASRIESLRSLLKTLEKTIRA